MSFGAEKGFSLNHMAAPSLRFDELIELAARLKCVGVEFRNDLPTELFDGESPARVKAAAQRHGLRILALSEVKRFNDWSETRREEALGLIETAVECGAEAISLIPVNDADFRPDRAEGGDNIRKALEDLAPAIEDAGILGFIEPLGFEISSLRYKRMAVDAITDVGATHLYRLVHDTFHHHLAGEAEIFPELTGIVHISGVVEPGIKTPDMTDGDRILVDGEDRLASIAQLRALVRDGYRGCFSYEPFAESVHALSDPEPALAASMEFIRASFEDDPERSELPA